MTQSRQTDDFLKPTLNYNKVAPEIDLSQSKVPSEAAIEHADVLLGAVTARLKRAVDAARDEAEARAASATPEQVLLRLRATVLECVEALEQLQTTQQYLRCRARAV